MIAIAAGVITIMAIVLGFAGDFLGLPWHWMRPGLMIYGRRSQTDISSIRAMASTKAPLIGSIKNSKQLRAPRFVTSPKLFDLWKERSGFQKL
jgi:hypothetical protein